MGRGLGYEMVDECERGEKERTSTGTFWPAIVPLSDRLDRHLRRISLAVKPTAGVMDVATKECALGLGLELSKEDKVDGRNSFSWANAYILSSLCTSLPNTLHRPCLSYHALH
jgi:hypothetical protein